MVSFENDVELVMATLPKRTWVILTVLVHPFRNWNQWVGWAGLARTLVTQQKENAFFLYWSAKGDTCQFSRRYHRYIFLHFGIWAANRVLYWLSRTIQLVSSEKWQVFVLPLRWAGHSSDSVQYFFILSMMFLWKHSATMICCYSSVDINDTTITMQGCHSFTGRCTHTFYTSSRKVTIEFKLLCRHLHLSPEVFWAATIVISAFWYISGNPIYAQDGLWTIS